MRKIFWTSVLAASLWLASCNDDETASHGGAPVNTSFQLSVPDDTAGIVKRYVVEAYQGDKKVSHVETADGHVELTLEEATDYTFLFWADGGIPNENESVYDATDLKAVKFRNPATPGELAFAASCQMNSSNVHATEVKLEVAVAQINFKETGRYEMTTGNELLVTYPYMHTLNVADGSVNRKAGLGRRAFEIDRGAKTIIRDYILASRDSVENLEIETLLNETTIAQITLPVRAGYRTTITGEFATTGATFAIECVEREIPEPEEPEEPEIEYVFYKVGDYYPEPDNAETATGVVFWIDTEDENYNEAEQSSPTCKVVALKEGQNLIWGPVIYQENVTPSASIGATDLEDGAANMEAVKEQANWENDYPAFKFCSDYDDGNWYLPALHELDYLYCAFNGSEPSTWDMFSLFTGTQNTEAQAAFNQKLEAAGGTILSNRYWTSTEYTLDNKEYLVGYMLWVSMGMNNIEQKAPMFNIPVTRPIKFVTQ